MSEGKMKFSNSEVKFNIRRYAEVHKKSVDEKFLDGESIKRWIKKNLKRIESLDSDQYQDSTLKIINRAKRLYELLLDPIVQDRMKESGVDIKDEDLLLDTVLEAQDSLDALYGVISGISSEDFSRKKQKIIKNTLLGGIAYSGPKKDRVIKTQDEIEQEIIKKFLRTNESREVKSLINNISTSQLIDLANSKKFHWDKLSPVYFNQLIQRSMALKLYSSISDVIFRAFDSGVPVTQLSASLSLQVFRKIKDLDGLKIVMEVVQDKDIELTKISYGLALNAFGSVRDLNGVNMVWDILKAKNLTLDVVDYGSAMNAFGDCKDSNGVQGVLDMMDEKDVEINVIGYNTAFNAFGKSEDIKRLQKLWKIIEMKNVELDESGYSSALNAFGKCKDTDGLYAVWGVMQDSIKKLDTIGYGGALNAFGNCEDSDGVTMVWESSKDSGLDLNVATYSSALNAFGKCGDGAGVRVVWNTLKEKNLELNMASYSVALKSFFITNQHELFESVYEELPSYDVENKKSFIFYMLIMSRAKNMHNKEIVDEVFDLVKDSKYLYTARDMEEILNVGKEFQSIKYIDFVKENLHRLSKVDQDLLKKRMQD